MIGFEPEDSDDLPPPPLRRVSEVLRDVVDRLDEAIRSTDNPELLDMLHRVLSDAGHVWSTAANIEREEDRDSQDWEHILDYQRAVL